MRNPCSLCLWGSRILAAACANVPAHPPPLHAVTGVQTRKSLGCGSKRRRLESTPSNLDGPQVPSDEKEAFVKTLPQYYK